MDEPFILMKCSLLLANKNSAPVPLLTAAFLREGAFTAGPLIKLIINGPTKETGLSKTNPLNLYKSHSGRITEIRDFVGLHLIVITIK